MDDDKLFQLYEKLYFHEIDMREKLNYRTQIYFAMIVAQLGLVAYLIKSVNWTNICFPNILIIMLTCASSALMALTIIWFIRSWYNFTYYFIPSAGETAEYKNTCIKLYEDFPDKEALVNYAMRKYLHDAYVYSSSNNTTANEQRSLRYHKTATQIIITFVVVIISCLSLVFIDKFYYKAILKSNVVAIDQKGDTLGFINMQSNHKVQISLHGSKNRLFAFSEAGDTLAAFNLQSINTLKYISLNGQRKELQMTVADTGANTSPAVNPSATGASNRKPPPPPPPPPLRMIKEGKEISKKEIQLND